MPSRTKTMTTWMEKVLERCVRRLSCWTRSPSMAHSICTPSSLVAAQKLHVCTSHLFFTIKGIK